MVKLVIMLLVLAGLMIAAPMLANNQGFVYIDTGSHVIQLSLVSMVIILIATGMKIAGIDYRKTGKKTPSDAT